MATFVPSVPRMDLDPAVVVATLLVREMVVASTVTLVAPSVFVFPPTVPVTDALASFLLKRSPVAALTPTAPVFLVRSDRIDVFMVPVAKEFLSFVNVAGPPLARLTNFLFPLSPLFPSTLTVSGLYRLPVLSMAFSAFTDTSPSAFTVPAISASALVSAMPTAPASANMLPPLATSEESSRVDVAEISVFPLLEIVAPSPTLADTSL